MFELSAEHKKLLMAYGVPLVIALLVAGGVYWVMDGRLNAVQAEARAQAEKDAAALDALGKAQTSALERLQAATEAKAGELDAKADQLDSRLTANVKETNDSFQKVADAIDSLTAEKNAEVDALKKQISGISVEAGDFSGIVDELIPKVVSIKTDSSVASGAIIKADGFIVTNYHVIDGKTGIKAVLSNKRSYDAQVIGFNQDNDVAVLKIDQETLPTFEFGNSNDLKVGEKVLALGNPIGLEFTVTQGIISALNRKVQDQAGVAGPCTSGCIQTDVPINPGNSGGPLVNKLGQLVGINTLKATGEEGLGFAIPSNFVKANVDEIMAKWQQKQQAQPPA